MQKQKKKQKFYSERNYGTWMYIKDDIQLKNILSIEGCGGKIPNHKTIIAKILDFCKRAIQKFKK